nr:unnamed protein product [Digitaria exilis]
MSDSDEYVDLPVHEEYEEEEESEEYEEEEEDLEEGGGGGSSRKKAKQHAAELKRLQEKDPEFYKYLKEHDKDLLGFDDDDDDEIEDDEETGISDDAEPVSKDEQKQAVKPITMEMVDSWCDGVENEKIGSIRSILQAFRRACHYGEDQGDNSAPKFSVMSGSVLDKVMHFVLKHMDRVLRQLLGAPSFGGKKEAISDLMLSKPWKRHGNLMRIYLANALHMITEMTDEQMIAFTIHRVRASAVFLAAFPSLLRKYVKKSYQKVYDWQYIFCLELWTSVVCGCSSDEEFRPLAYPLTQIIHGVACLVPSARYFPVRLRCVKMLNCIAEATGTFIPVSSLLLDMLEMKELRGRPDGGVGKAVNLFSVKQVDKKTVKTRAFQEACIYSVVDELAKHLAQWSYSIAFFEMSFIPLVRFRSFCKTIKADRFRKEMKDLIHQTEKEERCSPLSKYVATLHQRAQDRMDALDETSVIVGAESSTFSRRLTEAQKEQDEQDDDEGTIAFSKNFLTEKKKPKTTKEKNKKRPREHDAAATEEDLVEDLVLSSDDEDNDNQGSDEDDSVPVEDDSDEDFVDPDSEYKKQKKAKLKKRNMRQPISNNKTKRKARPKKKAKH